MKQTIGDRLRKFGTSKFRNLNEFADALGIKQPSLSRYVNDKSKPGADMLHKLANLGCDIDWLLGVDKPTTTQNKEVSDLTYDKAQTIGDRMREYALRNGTIGNFAGEVKIPRTVLSAYFSDKRKPGAEALIKLRALGCDINWLLTGEKSGVPPTIPPDYMSETLRLGYKIREINEALEGVKESIYKGQLNEVTYSLHVVAGLILNLNKGNE